MNRRSAIQILLLGAILLLVSPATALPIELITGNNTLDHWTIENQTTGTQIIIPGDGTARFFSEGADAHADLSKNIDLTAVDKIIFTSVLSAGSKTSGPRLAVFIDDTAVQQYQKTDLNAIHTIDVSAYTGYHKVTFRVLTGHDSHVAFTLQGLSMMANTALPVVTSLRPTSSSARLGEMVTATIHFTLGDRTEHGDELILDWGDGNPASYPLKDSTSPLSVQHMYAAANTYTVSCHGHNRDYGDSSSPSTAPISVAQVEFSATPSQGTPPLHVDFFPDVQNADELVWDFGDGRTDISDVPHHIYDTPGTYTVTLTVKTPEGQRVSLTKNNLISVGTQYVRGAKSSYTHGENPAITYSLLPPQPGQRYQIRIYAADDSGYPTGPALWSKDITELHATIPVNTPLSAGTYIAVLAVDEKDTELSGGITIQPTPSDKPKDPPKDPTSSETPKNPDTFPELAAPLGVGDTFITFRVLEKLTGTPIPGATVRVVGKQATNPVAWIGQQFGQAWGEKIIGTELNGTTDAKGAITFALLRTVKYEVTASSLEATETLSYQPTAPDAEQIVRLNTQKSGQRNPTQTILTSITGNQTGITVTYEDTTSSTTSLRIIIEEQGRDGTYRTVETRTSNAQKTTEHFGLSDTAGKSYRVTLTADTSLYGTVTRTAATTFPGPLVKIGIPDSLYVYLVIFLLFTFGAIGTQTTAPIVGVCICFLGWIFYFFGWMFAIGTLAPVALGFATIVASLYYLRARDQAGG